MKRRRLRMNDYAVVSRAIDEGIAFGLSRARKHLEEGQHPTDESLAEHLEREIMNALSEVVRFDDDEDG